MRPSSMAGPMADERAPPATAPHAEAEGKPQKQRQKMFAADKDAPGRAAHNQREGSLSRAPPHGGDGWQDEEEHLEACGTVVVQQQPPHPAAPRAKTLWQTLANAIQLLAARASLPLQQASAASSAPVAAAAAAAAAARALPLHALATPSRPSGSALAPGGGRGRAESLRSHRTCPSQLPTPWFAEAGPGSGSLLVSGSMESDTESGSSGSSGSVLGPASNLTGSEADSTSPLDSGSPRKWAMYYVPQSCNSTQMASATAACGAADAKRDRSPERVRSRRVSVRIEPEDLDPYASGFKLKHSPSASRRKSLEAPFSAPAPGSPSTRFASPFTPAGVSPRACQRQRFDVIATVTIATAHGTRQSTPHAGLAGRAISTHCRFKEVTAITAAGKGITAVTTCSEECRSAEPMRGGPFLASGRSKSAKGLQLGSMSAPCACSAA